MVKLSRKLVSSLLNRCAAVQRRQYGECCTLWINWEGTLPLSLVESLFLLFSTGAQLYKQNNMGSVLLYGLIIYFFLFSTGGQLYREDNMGSVLPYGLIGKVLCALA